MKKLPCCPHPDCSKAASVIRHGFYKTRSGKRRRYLCRGCGKTFCLTKGTPYYRLQHRRSTFDDVASLSVEGLSKSAISRVKSIAWNTVDRWLEMVAACCRRFSDQSILGLDIRELQADEIRTISGGKSDVIWIFATIDVWSRLWPVPVLFAFRPVFIEALSSPDEVVQRRARWALDYLQEQPLPHPPE